ncbi:hypothetical protein CIK05_15445 [Bdellovibrio sp. qaytius]|nr:hypothetical protein CIK05_15445 [Bdellovibrio sp. qaytius]
MNTLSLRLKESSMESHQNAENSSFIKDLFQGSCSENSYAQYVWALKEIYQALEEALDQHQNHEQVKLVYFPELFRTEPLQKDAQTWAPAEVPETLKAAVAQYVSHIKNLKVKQPHLLVSHAYVRYLGDLSGGQILGRILNSRWSNNPGLNFYKYSFNDFTDRKNQYRAKLDEIGQQLPAHVDEMCDEAVTAFKLNENVFAALH